MDGILTGSTDLMLTFLLLSLQYEISFKLAVGDQSFLSVFYFFQERAMRVLYLMIVLKQPNLTNLTYLTYLT